MKKTLLFALAALMLPTAAMANYCGYDGNATNPNNRNRQMVSFGLTDGTTTSTITVNQGVRGAIYQDKMSQSFNTSPGATVSFSSINWSGSWMHGYLYIDYRLDGVTDDVFNTTLNRDGNGTGELVSYCFYSPTNADTGTNSAGETVEKSTSPSIGTNGSTMPSFTIPATLPAGSYRARFKVDWNHLDPCGHPSETSNTMTANSGVIVDFTINVVVTNHTIVVPEVAADAHYTLNVVAGDETLTAGSHTIATGTMVTITATAKEGYELNGLNINGTTPVNNGVPFELTTDINSIDVAVNRLGTPTTVTFVQPEHGTIAVTHLGAAIESGATVHSGNQLVVTVTPEGRCELTAIKANGTEVATSSPFTYTVPENLDAVEFTAELAVNYASGITYSGDNTKFTPSYVETATTTGAVENLNYSATARPANTLNGETGGAVVMDSQITAQRGSNFTLNLNAHNVSTNTTSAHQDLRYTYCLIFADWNANGDFELVERHGKYEDETGWVDNIKTNYDMVMKIAQELTVPEDAANTARIRLIYQNAWKKNVNTTGYDVVIEDGIAYDIVVNTVAATVNHTVTISGVTTGAQPEGTATYGIGGEIVITDAPMTAEGALAGTVLARLNSHPTESTATSFSVEEGTTVYVNAISDFKYASVEEGQENPWATLDELVINVGGVLVAPSEEGYDKAYLNDYENDIIKVDGRYCIRVEVTGDMTVSARFADDAQLSGLENVAVEAANAPAVYFNIQGVRVSEDNMAPGIYVRRQGNKVAKVLVK